MSKKKITIISIFLTILIILCLCFLLFYNNNNTVSDLTYSFLSTKENTKTYDARISLENEELKNKSSQEITNKLNSYPNLETREEALVSPTTPFYNEGDGWVSNVLTINENSATVEIFNASTEDITINNDFVSFLGVNDDNTGIKSNITKGLNEVIKPGESAEITVSDGNGAKFLKIGYGNAPKDWAMYYVNNYTLRVSEEWQFMNDDNKDNDTFNLKASITPKIFKSLNIGTLYSRKLTDTTVGELKLTKQEIKDNPYATLGFIEVDIYNKTNQQLVIDGLDILHKQNNKVVNTQSVKYEESVQSQSLNLIKIPFKSMGGKTRTTLVLKTNMGNITIHDPELLFSTILHN